MRSNILAGVVLAAVSAAACSSTSSEADGRGEADLTRATACEADAECVAYQPLPCCSSRQEAIHQSGRAEAEREAQAACLAAACIPDTELPAARAPRCQAGSCRMVDLDRAPAPVPSDLVCTASSECAAYEPLPCCSKRRDAVNVASVEAARERAARMCLAAACAPDVGPDDDGVPSCELGVCMLVAPRR